MFGAGNALISVMACAPEPILATPEKRGERTSAKNERPSGASAKGTSEVVRESGTTWFESTRRHAAVNGAWHQPP